MKKFLKLLALGLVTMTSSLLLVTCGSITQQAKDSTGEQEIQKPIDNGQTLPTYWTVTFDSCGGSSIDTVKTEPGKLLTKPSNPVKTNYIFDGWYLDLDYRYEFRFAIDKITEDTTLYAKWTIALKNYTISFDTNSGNTVQPITQLEGTILDLPVPTKNGLTFDYWYTDDFQKFTQDRMPSSNITLYAKWKVAVDIYIDEKLTGQVYTNEENNFHLTDLSKPDDITVDPFIHKYFYGYFWDYYLTVPVDENSIFTKNSRIYAKWIDINENDYKYTVNNNEATLTGFSNENDTNILVVPKYINSFPVTAISGAFENKFRIKNVIFLCDDLKSIRNGAFKNCTGLTNITIPNTVTILGDGVFYGCSNLTHITIPNNVTSIGGNAFYACTSLTSVTISNSITNIFTDAFYGCNNLIEMNYLGSLNDWVQIGFGSEKSNPTYFTKKLIINNEEITRAVIQNGVTKISNYAFYGCSSLTDVIISSSVNNIGSNAFPFYNNLSSISVSIDNHYYTSRDNEGNEVNALIKINDYKLISGCKNTIIPNGVTHINDNVFNCCPQLTTIYIPSSVTNISQKAFEYCDGIASIKVDPNNTCYTSQDIDGNETNAIMRIASFSIGLILGCKNTIIPRQIYDDEHRVRDMSSIEGYAFAGCTGLTTITIPSTVYVIRGSAFRDCTGLVSVIIEGNNTRLENPFYGCSALKTIYCKASSSKQSWYESNTFGCNAEIVWGYQG